MIKDAEDMGGLDFVFKSKLTPTDQDDAEVAPHRDSHSANAYKAISKHQVDPESSHLWQKGTQPLRMLKPHEPSLQP